MSAQHTPGRLSASMWHVLDRTSRGLSLYGDCMNRSEYGARTLTVKALRQRGLIAGESLTDAGRAAIAKAVEGAQS